MWTSNSGPPIFTDEEIQRIMAHAAEYGRQFRASASELYRGDGFRWTALLSVLANYGARLSEALTMHRNQIDFTRNRITFRTLKRHRRPCPDCRKPWGQRVHVPPELTACPHCGTPMPKAKPVYRTMPLYPQVAEAIQAYLATHDSPRVFPPRMTATTDNAERIRAWRMFQKCCKRAGVPPKKLHSLRASFITRVLRETRDIKITQDAAGHASLATTSGYAFALDFEEKMAQLSVIHVNGAVNGQAWTHRAPDEPKAAAGTPPTPEDLGLRLPVVPGLRDKLAPHGLDSPTKLAVVLGTTRQYAEQILSGRHRIGIKVARRIGDAIGVPYAEVMAWQFHSWQTVRAEKDGNGHAGGGER